MGIIQTETFVNENGAEMKKDIYANGMTITYKANQPEQEEPATDPVLERLDSIETALNALTADSLTVSSVEAAILEGVNEV